MATQVPNRMIAFDGGNFAFRNKIINGNFDIWQRGTEFSNIASSAYSADRWNVLYDGSGGTRIITRQNFNLGQTSVPNEPTYFLRFNQSVAGTGATFNVLQQKIESVRTLANKNIVVSFYAKAASSIAITVYGQQWYGSGGSPFTFTNIPASLNITTSWQKFTVNLTVPSIAGKTIGVNDRLELIFSLPRNNTFTFDIAQVQLEEGSSATPFEQRPIGVELALCQRYFCKSFPLDVAPTTNTSPGSILSHEPVSVGPGAGGTIHIGQGQFPVPMRATPVMTFYNPRANTAINTVYLSDTTNEQATIHSFIVSPDRLSYFNVSSTFSGTNPVGSLRICHWHFTADAEF